MSPARRRRCIDQVKEVLEVSERRVCRVLGQHRSTQRKVPCGADDEEALTDDIVALARQYGRYGYRRVTALLHAAGWSVNHKRVERIWRREGLKVPQRQPKRGRLWLNDGSCIRLRPEHPGHVWAEPAYKVPAMRSIVGRQAEGYDFVEARTHDGRKALLSLSKGSASSRSSTRPAASAWRWWSPASSATKMCLRPWPSCSLTGARLDISDRTILS